MDLNEIEDRIWRSRPIITLEVGVSFGCDPGFAASVRRQLVQSAIAEGSMSPIVFSGQTREDLVESFIHRNAVPEEPSPQQLIEDKEHIWYVRPSHWRNDYWRFDGSGRVDAGFNIYDGRTECRGEYARNERGNGLRFLWKPEISMSRKGSSIRSSTVCS